jgi:N-sulfoglucosamine sulfohydrolase
MFRLFCLIFVILGSLGHSGALAQDRPNILWITSEDNSVNWIGAYGGTNAKTPNIDKLATEGFRYLHCFDNAAVCAPTRNMWITGMYPVSLGTHPMRSRYQLPDLIVYYNQALKKIGYHTGNQSKTDYNLSSSNNPMQYWDVTKGAMFGWRERKKGQPFFSVCNITDSHESRAFGSVENTKNDPSKMILAAYHPDLPDIRKNYAKYGDAVGKMDGKVGQILEGLKKDGLYEDTIIIYNSDHGGVMPRSKRFLYAAGIHCPLIVRIPEKWKSIWPADKPGMTVDRIVSFIDMPKTWLSLAGAQIPKSYQGTVFLGKGTETAPKYHFAFRERADERLDHVRVMRTGQYAYHKNYMPYAPSGHRLAYLWQEACTKAWVKHHQEGKTNEITGRWFRPRVSEEFYDCKSDYDNVKNLIDDPKHQAMIKELKAALRAKQLEIFDSGLLPESMRASRSKKHNKTIYAMVRDPKLYPLAQYLDAADRSLERDPKHLDALVKNLAHADSGMRYWAIVGIHLLGGKAASAKAQIQVALKDEEHQVRILAAWTLIKMGDKNAGMAAFKNLIANGTHAENALCNTIDWMGADGKPLVEAYFASAKGKRNQVMSYLATVHGVKAPPQPKKPRKKKKK